MISFDSWIMKNIVLLSLTSSPRFRFPVKLIYRITIGSASNACCLLKSIAIIFLVINKVIII